MPSPGQFGGPGIPGRTRIAKATVTSNAVMEQDQFGRFIKHAENSGDELMRVLADDMEHKARALAPVRSGRLRRSIKALLFNHRREVRLTSDVPYAVVMEEGSRPHLIHGVRKNFRWKNNTRWFRWNDPKYGPVDGWSDAEIEHQMGQPGGYVNWSEEHGATVRHPGTKPKKFMHRAWRSTWEDARRIMRQVYRG